MQDSAATRRQEALARELGVQIGLAEEDAAKWLYARFPRDLMEDLIDRAPVKPRKDDPDPEAWAKHQKAKATWVSGIPDLDERVLNCHIRYSWCWPICLPYSVVTDPRDEILHSERRPHYPILLSQEAVAEILGVAQQRVSVVTRDLIGRKRLALAVPAGRKEGLATFVLPRAFFDEEARGIYYSTVVKTAQGECRLPPPVLRSLSNLINKLGPANRLISVPNDGEGEEAARVMSVADYSTRVLRDLADIRTEYLKAWQPLARAERMAYKNRLTAVRILIDQPQPSETLSSSSTSGFSSTAVPRVDPEKAAGVGSTSSYTGEETTTKAAHPRPDPESRERRAREGLFYEGVSALFAEAKKGAPTPRQLAAAWKLMPADAQLADLEHFLLRPKDQARMDRIEHAGVILMVMAEFAGEWARGAKARAAAALQEADARRIHAEQSTRAADDAAAAERRQEHLRANPQDCPFCHGKGWYNTMDLPVEIRPKTPSKMLKCHSCPAGEASGP